MSHKRIARFFTPLATASFFLGTCFVMAQEPGKPKDDALDSLLEKLDESKKAPEPSPKNEKNAKAKKSEAQDPKSPSREVAPKDQEIDNLLEKLGETKDEPAPDERPKSGPGQEGTPPMPPDSKSTKPDDLTDPQKKLDEHLEELTGRKHKKKGGDGGGEGNGSGPLADVIKQMREVEQRLGKPDTGAETRKKQTQIVKNLDQMIEQMRRSSQQSSSSRKKFLATKQGKQPGSKSNSENPGTMGGNAPLTKPAKPTEKRSLAGGKDEWGHLPPDLRQELENVFKEEALERRADLIRRYYLSLSKKRLTRGE